MSSERICSIPSCGKAHYAKGWCYKHWKTAHVHGDPLYSRPALPETCTIEGCSRPHAHKGLCRAHYHRRRRSGTPHKSRKEMVQEFIRDVVLPCREDQCLLWPFGKNRQGYGFFMHHGKTRKAHRFICILAHGEPKTSSLEAAHWCGVPTCVNPRHLSWKTNSENQEDKIRHGTDERGEKSPNTKLTNDDVIRIRNMAKNVRHKDIAELFGMTLAGIRGIIYRGTWKHI